MTSQHLSNLSSLKGEVRPEDLITPVYKEAYRLAIDQLLSGGRDAYREFLKGERVGSFLSEDELLFITAHVQRPPPPVAPPPAEDVRHVVPSDSHSSSGTYWPTQSDVVTPDLELGWPEVAHERLQTSVELLHHPPRQNSPPIKEVIRKHIQDARQVIAIVMDTFTDIDIFKEAVDAAGRGVPVYVLLDDLNLKGFLAMAESQDIKIPQLRNMRVRTVRGHEYLTQSGAKFHGAMKQNFLLFDCKTAIYGSYSFMWSFEKIHLSMVQVITGHLVRSYDEEFRTLYARSAVPEVLCPARPPCAPKDVANGRPVMTSYVASPSNAMFERTNHLRHTLDATHMKSQTERQVSRKLPEERIYEEPIEHAPLKDYKSGGFNHTPQLNPVEMSNFLKRHSYAAGDRHNSPQVPQNQRHGASNWNIPRDTCPPLDRSNHPPMMDDFSQVQQMSRGQNVRPSHNDKHLLSVQEHMPSLENTSKSFMRTWRIESYLKHPDTSFTDTLDQYETADTRPSSALPSRMRSSLAFNSTIPEHSENHHYVNNSSTNLSGNLSPAPHYSSMQWGTEEDDRRRNFEEFKRQSLQKLDNTRDNASYNADKISQNSIYASLGRSNGRKLPDISTDNWDKRHSVADPRNSEFRSPYESPGHMYGRHMERGPERVPAHYGHYGSSLNEDQRSVSHYDVKNFVDIQKHPSWQEPPSRTVSAAALDGESKGEPFIPTEKNQTHFLKKSTMKIRSLLNIPEKKEAHYSQSVEQLSLKSGHSTDTLTAEDEEQHSQILLGRDPQHLAFHHHRTSADNPRSRLTQSCGKPSNPRFNVEEHRQASTTRALSSRMHQQNLLSEARLRACYETGSPHDDAVFEEHLKSRFESHRAPERKYSSHRDPSGPTGAPSTEKEKGLSSRKGPVLNEHHHSRTSHGHHENKLGKFIQKMGSLINKK
ncbi:unnamed protein product [Boreogadus saida]